MSHGSTPSTPSSQVLSAQFDEGQIPPIVFSIVSKAKENNNLSSLTPRLVRSEVEDKLGLSSGILDEPRYKTLVKRSIHDAMVCTQSIYIHPDPDQKRESDPSTSNLEDGGTRKSDSKPKGGRNRHSSVSKSIKSTVCSEESINPGNQSSSSAKVASSGPKRKRPSAPIVQVRGPGRDTISKVHDYFGQSDSDAETSDVTPRVAPSSDRMAAIKSGSEMSSLVDEPPKKKGRGKSKNSESGKVQAKAKTKRSKNSTQPLSKDEETIKRLKSLVLACGVRKQWARELANLSTSAQIEHIRKTLTDLGMVGRLSMEQAGKIRARRELAQELDDVQTFERAVVSGKPLKAEGRGRRMLKKGADTTNDADIGSDSGSESESDRQPPKGNTARRSIMAFLQDQSSDDN
ncbi:hypothetical protein B0F90DRAFT_1811298 [Multifurca ochricompacta]|uniref:Uncharacterized protein n=1 Tax=Multifurca ochricompacta TaxID=376703 RepID=A0AAD4LZP8_9AGAM|nr:hypothetical protein B0F90DRAFT_1811298 [Multifurca ochricompacta]